MPEMLLLANTAAHALSSPLLARVKDISVRDAVAIWSEPTRRLSKAKLRGPLRWRTIRQEPLSARRSAH